MAFDNNTNDQDKEKPEPGEDLIEQAKEEFETCREVWEPNHRESLEDIRFGRLEEQWPEAIRRQRELEGRPCLTLNQLHTFVFQVINDARQNKPGIIVHPVGAGADPETAEIYNGLIRHIEQSSDADVAYDTAMDFAVSGGFGFYRINTRYTCDDTFEQDLAIDRLPNPQAVFPDPHSTAADSSDWNRCFILDQMPKEAFEARWPGKDPVSFNSDGHENREVSDEEMVQIAEWWKREEIKRTIVALSAPDIEAEGANPDAAAIAQSILPEQMIVGMDVYEANKVTFDLLGVKIVGKPRDVMTYKVTQRILSGADVLETVEWAGKYIPIVPVWGEELNIEGRRVMRSLIRGAKDAQRMFNYWRTTSTELVALAPKTPFIGVVGQFVTDSAKWATANTQTHAYIEFDNVQGAPAPQRQPFASVPAGALQEAANAQNDIMSIVGIYKSSIGAQSNETSGVAINARDRQADTGSFHFTDNLSRSIRHAGRILIDLIPKTYSTPRILRILGPDGTPDTVKVNQPTQVPMLGPNGQQVMGPQMGPGGQPQIDPATGQIMQELKSITRIFDLTAGSYDLVVKAGPSFASKREEFVTLATELIRAYPPLAPVLTDLIVKNYDIPDSEEIVKRIERMMPPQMDGAENPEIMQGKQLIQKLGMANQALKLENDRLKGRQDYDHGKLEVEAFKAQTDRFEVLAPQGVPLDPMGVQALVMQSIKAILANPEMLLEGGETAAMPQAMPGGAGGVAPPQPPAPTIAPAAPPQF